MSLEVGRVGVRPDQLDNYGRINPNSQFIQNLLNDLPAWTDLPVWKRGTEQLLPVNDDEPDTSPILCDIEYPVADLKNNQYFTYRQSPTQKDGKAKIRGIRGKTLVWNQLVNDGNFTSNWSYSNASGSVSNNVLTFTATATNGYTRVKNKSDVITNGHKYLGMIDVKCTSEAPLIIYFDSSSGSTSRIQKTFGTLWETASLIWTANVTGDNWYPRIYDHRASDWDAIQLRNAMIFDLTKMFGAGNEPTTVDEFKALFPLPYYKYNTGSLLDFTGTKVKTVGKNLLGYLNSRTSGGIKFTYDSETGGINCKGTATANAYNDASASLSVAVNYPLLQPGSYKMSVEGTKNANNYPRGYMTLVYPDGTTSSAVAFYNETTLTVDREAYAYLRIQVGNGEVVDNTIYPMIRYANSDNGFETYKSNETDLPISTFFPTGMKSAGAVYDELTPTRAITRVGQVDLGSLTWTATTNNRYITTGVASLIKAPKDNATVGNILCPKYATVTYSDIVDNSALGIAVNGSSANKGNICIRDTGTYADASAFKTALSGVMLNYELAVEDVEPTMSFGD